jgi:hypothetical protein
MSKYKIREIGEKVKIKEDLNIYDFDIVEDMIEFVGKEVTIVDDYGYDEAAQMNSYAIEEDKQRWYWYDHCFVE